jgi:thymidine kinase
MSELNLIIGCMFSGKTTELLRIANRLKSVGQQVLLINYHEDIRYSTVDVKTHDNYNSSIKSHFIESLNEIDYTDYSVICINEAQFFCGLRDFCIRALGDNKKLYISGLDGDYKQEKFGEILDLVPLADKITKLHAFCKLCGDCTPAYFTRRLTKSTTQKLIGTDEYIPVCRKHLL